MLFYYLGDRLIAKTIVVYSIFSPTIAHFYTCTLYFIKSYIKVSHMHASSLGYINVPHVHVCSSGYTTFISTFATSYAICIFLITLTATHLLA